MLNKHDCHNSKSFRAIRFQKQHLHFLLNDVLKIEDISVKTKSKKQIQWAFIFIVNTFKFIVHRNQTVIFNPSCQLHFNIHKKRDKLKKQNCSRSFCYDQQILPPVFCIVFSECQKVFGIVKRPPNILYQSFCISGFYYKPNYLNARIQSLIAPSKHLTIVKEECLEFE